MKFSLIHFILVGAGGFIGAGLRYAITLFTQEKLSADYFFAGTALVNLIGCFLIGMAAGFIEMKDWVNPELRIFIFTGILGGFTTFSAFAFQTFSLFNKNALILGVLNLGAQVLGGILLVWAGYRLIIR